MKGIVAGMLLLLPAVAGADILAWEDANGVRHYTNLKAEIPKELRDSAQVVVDEAARRAEAAATRETARPEAEVHERAPEAPRAAQVVYDRSVVSRAYLDGLERGLETARAMSGGAGGSVEITGPLAVAHATSAVPAFGYPLHRYPLITTSFDRGRSRHLTLRQLLQDQFALDREAPFIFEERALPPCARRPLSVELNPFLPRGLPRGTPRHTRVITR